MGGLPHGLQRGGGTGPKRVIAVADYGQYGGETETIVAADGERKDEPVQITPDGRPIWQPYILERAFICRNLNWKVLPEDLDEKSLELKQAQESLIVFESFRQYAVDLKGMTEGQQNVVDSIERFRELLRKPNDD